MKPAREQFLAGAACPKQHDRDVGTGDALDGAHDLEHARRSTDDAAEQRVAMA